MRYNIDTEEEGCEPTAPRQGKASGQFNMRYYAVREWLAVM